jgi:signal transduction histidine kinase
MNDAGDGIDAVRVRGIADEGVRPFLHLPLDADMPVTEAIRTGRTIYLSGRAEAVERYPTVRDANAYVAADAWVALPLVYGGNTLGAIALGFGGGRSFSVEDHALVDALGRHCAQAIERARLLDAERTARDEAEGATRAKSNLLAKVSHETRQPVHATVGWVETIQLELHGPVTEAQHDALRRIKQNQSRLLGVLNDLLDMSRIEAGKLDLHLTRVVVASVVDAVESAVAPQMRDKGIVYDFCRPEASVAVRADLAQLVGILTNLVSNAAKFTPAEGRVTVSCHTSEHSVSISVEDSGIGIASDMHERVFEPFFQVEAGFTRTTMGTGLGLAISREAARAMGGDITLHSAKGSGSTFTVQLPRSS